MRSAVRTVAIVAVALLLQFPLAVQAAAQSDLVVSTITYSPEQPTVGDEITLSFFVQNQSVVRAGAFDVVMRVGGESHSPVARRPSPVARRPSPTCTG